ncbi:MAG: flagellar biosynthetic protein FliO [Candidatus Sericytochromatia bacterium]|nr:flagellar biosynthetic protein FliO [Candidatus Tanganyikabacteria bacterium]
MTWLALAAPALAQAATGDGFVWRDYQDPALAVAPQQPLWLQAFWFLVKLGFVIALIYASLLAYRKLLGQRAPADFGRIRVLETARLAGTQSLYLVQVGDQTLLVGSNGAGLLVKLAEWPADQPPPEAAQVAFGQTVRRAADRPDDFEAVIDSSLRQAVIPPKSEG